MMVCTAFNRIALSVMGLRYYCYFMACFFAGLFRHTKIPNLSHC